MFVHTNHHPLFINMIQKLPVTKAKCKICGKDFENKEADYCSRECTLAGAF